MALNYEEQNTLMQNTIFRGRVKVSALNFANSIMIEASTVPAHNARLRWANTTFQQPDAVTAQTVPPVVIDPAVKGGTIDTDGDSSITDAALQVAVETVVNKMI